MVSPTGFPLGFFGGQAASRPRSEPWKTLRQGEVGEAKWGDTMIYWGCQWGYHPDFSNGTICEFHGILKWDDMNGISIDSRLMPSGNLTQEWGDLNQQRLGFNKQRLGFRKEMADLTNTNQKFHKQTWTLNTQKRLIFTNKHGKFVNKHRGGANRMHQQNRETSNETCDPA